MPMLACAWQADTVLELSFLVYQREKPPRFHQKRLRANGFAELYTTPDHHHLAPFFGLLLRSRLFPFGRFIFLILLEDLRRNLRRTILRHRKLYLAHPAPPDCSNSTSFLYPPWCARSSQFAPAPPPSAHVEPQTTPSALRSRYPRPWAIGSPFARLSFFLGHVYFWLVVPIHLPAPATTPPLCCRFGTPCPKAAKSKPLPLLLDTRQTSDRAASMPG
jgi:hypothetical protein